MKLFALLVLPVVLYCQPAPVAQEAGKASLEGQVLNAITGEPLRKVRVTLRMNVAAPQANRQRQPPGPPPTPPAGITVGTDAAGLFAFPNLDPGSYQLVARRDGFANAQIGVRDGSKNADPIILTAGDRKRNLAMKMTPYGAISGRISDEDGDPIRGQQVSAMVYQYTTRGRELVETRNATSDDLGEYRIFDLPAGKYFVRAGPRPLRVPRNTEDAESFAAAYYPGVQDAASVPPLELGAGQQLRDLSFILRKARLPSIRGRVIAPPGASISVGLMMTSENGSSSSSSGIQDKDGKFELHSVPPGRIFVIGSYTSAGGQRFNAQLQLQVGSSDINGVELRPIPPMEVSGRARIEGQTPARLSDIQIALQGPGRSSGISPKEDGTLVFRDVEPSIYRVTPRTIQNLYLKSVRWGTVDVTDGEIDLTNGLPPDTELSVVLGADAGQIEGAVKNDRGLPADAATITLVPTGSRRSRSYYKTGLTDAAGHFNIRGVAPGSYKVFAWDTVNPNAVMYDPEFLRPYEAAGQIVEVASNDKQSVELKLTLNKQN